VTIENAQVDDTISLTGRATSATSGTNAIQYSLVNTSVNVAIISGTNIVIKGRGLITLRASQPSGNFYSVSNDADQTITVNFPQTISFDAGTIINKNYGNAPFTPSLSTTASPSYSSYTFSVPSNNGIVTTNGSLLTIVGVGTVTVTATQASANYYSSASATVSLVVDKGTQTLTFDKFSRLFGIDPFTPTVTTNASPSYSAYTFSVPSENTVARTINNSTQLEIIGIGRVLVTVTQAENALYYSASATTRFTVKVNLLKSVYINLIDRTNTREFAFVQDVGPTYFVFPTTANFRDYTRKFIVSDVLDYFERVDMLESHIQLATSERNIIDTHQSAVEHFLASNESDIQQLENRLDTAESDLQIWDLRVDSNTERISTNETIWSGIESQIDTLETEYSELETNLLVVEGRISIQETDIDQLVSRADSNASRISLDQIEWSGLETRINVLDSRQTNTESELTLFSSHLEIQVENSITSVNQRLTTDQSLLQQFSNHLESVESDIDVLQSRTSLTEVDLVHLDNVFTGYESTLDSTKQTLYAISDGNLESMLSSLQQIQTEFTESVQVENIIELRERLNDLDSVLKELLETP
jgi:predicted  nucleic acid-binding Zn-ribbon protein